MTRQFKMEHEHTREAIRQRVLPEWSGRICHRVFVLILVGLRDLAWLAARVQDYS